MHFGIVSPPVPGHIHPFGALGRELIQRGHRVTFIHMLDVERQARAEGLEFAPVGESGHPPGSLPISLQQLGRLQGLAALRFTIRAVQKTTEMFLHDAPKAILGAKIDTLLVDQTEPAGGTIAEHLGLPFVTICNALLLNREPAVPPPFASWSGGSGAWGRARNLAGYAISDRVMSPVTSLVNSYRRRWKLRPHRSSEDSFSTLAQISQQPPAFDFPRLCLPPTFHYAGPFRNKSGVDIPFPWERLDGRPIIYASLGTLQYLKENMFRCFAEACAGVEAQLVITHCGGLDARAIQALPANPLVVNYAPQREILAKARLALTHAGLNTVLDAFTFGVPVMAVPITFEQPAIAARVRFVGAGLSLPLRHLAPSRLKNAIREILRNPEYGRNAQRIAESIRASGGVSKTAGIVERVTCARPSLPATQ